MERDPTDPDDESLEAMVRLAMREPDPAVVRGTCAGGREGGRSCLFLAGSSVDSDSDRLWLAVNLSHNPEWGRWLQQSRPASARWAFSRRSEPPWPRVVATMICVFAVVLTAALDGTPRARLAAMASYGYGPETRFRNDQGPQSQTSTGVLYLRAARARTPFGHRADPALVEAAGVHLEVAYHGTEDPFQRAEAAYFRATAALLDADRDDAIHWLQASLSEHVEDYRIEAKDLLRRLDRTPINHSPMTTN